MHITAESLQKISEGLVDYMQKQTHETLQKELTMKAYHGFIKSRFPDSVLKRILTPHNLEPADVQIELVKVETNLSHEIHIHKEAHALTTVIGKSEHMEDPVNALAFIEGEWVPVNSGDSIDIPPNTPHTFTVEDDGVMYFLSVQAPPIERAGHDDYYLHTST